jgi:hypothetical protein
VILRALLRLTLLLAASVVTSCSAAPGPLENDVSVEESSLFYSDQGTAAHWPAVSWHPGSGKGADIGVCYRTTGIPVPSGVSAGSLDSINSTDDFNRGVYAAEAIANVRATWGRVADINIVNEGLCSNFPSTNGWLELDITNSANCPNDPYGVQETCPSGCPANGTGCACPGFPGASTCDCRGDTVAGHPCFTHTDGKCCGLGSSAGVGFLGANNHATMLLDIATATHPITEVHEMGHVLGFYHEFTRVDWSSSQATTPCTTDADCSAHASDVGGSCVVPTGGGTAKFCRQLTGNKITPQADFDSVMAATYLTGSCTQDDSDGLVSPTNSLSPWDVMGAQYEYGVKPGGSVVVSGGECANISGGQNGAAIIQYPCFGAGNDQFASIITASGERLLQATVGSLNECMDVQGGRPTSGVLTPMISYGCTASNSNGNERFQLNGMHLRAMGNMCVAATGTTAGSQLVLRRCDNARVDPILCGTPAAPTLDHWDVYGSGLRLSNTNLCVTFPVGVLAPNVRPTLTTCSLFLSTQSFAFANNEIAATHVTSTGGNLCLNVFGGTTNDLSAVGLYNGCATGLRNEAFYLTGPIQTMGQCLTALGSFATQLDVYDCDPLDAYGNVGEEQEFDYYFK